MARKKWKHKNEPSRSLWIAAATREARKLGIDPQSVLDRDKRRVVVLARMRAWKRILGMGCYSIAGVARISGHDHTSVVSGLAHLNDMRRKVILARWNARKASRVPPPPVVIAPAHAADVSREIAYRDAWRASLHLGRRGVADPHFVHGLPP